MDSKDQRPPTDTAQGRTESGSTMTASRERTMEAAGEARSEVSHVAQEARDQASHVMHEAQAGVSDVVDEARRVIHDEADKQTHTLAESVQRVAGDLRSMADASEEHSVASDYVGRIGRSLDDVARRLEDGGIDGALDEMRSVARRHPGMFIAGSALSGFALARIMRHADAPQQHDGDSARASGAIGAGSDRSTGQGTAEGEGQLTEYGRSQLRSPEGSGGRQEDIDLREDYERRPGDAPQLREDMQEWVRP